ncbi:MAG: hypothetical protein ACRD9R_06075 [Pyrinomonadaceae bacterium]
MPSSAKPSLPLPEISCVNPLLHADGLKRLFVENERTDYPGFFDQAYPSAVAEGAKAWIGTNAEGRVVMHASRFPHPFLFGERRVTGGLIVNIMVAKEYRTHHPARALFERYVSDSRADGECDFLYTETTERGANVLKVNGASVIGRVGRLVLPIQEAQPGLDLAMRAYHGMRGIGTGARSLTATHHPAASFSAESFDVPVGASDRLRGIHGRGLYQRRVKDYPTAQDHWITVEGDGHTAAALVRGPEPNGLATVLKFYHHPSQNVAGVVLAMVPALRRIGCRRLQILTLLESEFAGELRRAGFIGRESLPLVALPLSPAGEEVVKRVGKWQITQLDLDS